MGSLEQWQDAFAIAETIHTQGKPVPRAAMDEYARIVCDRYDTVFKYDPYADSYSFRDHRIEFNEPEMPRCRRIADVDLEELRKGTEATKLTTPAYANLFPLYAVLPSTVLVYNYSKMRAVGLTERLKGAFSSWSSQPTILDVFPGAIFIFKHNKNNEFYRVMILEDVTQGDREPAFKLIFLDICQMLNAKLHKLYILPPEFSLQKYPPLLHCSRYLGIGSIRAGYVEEMIKGLNSLYEDKPRRKVGLPAVIYKEEDGKLVIDFVSIRNDPVTEAMAFHRLRGHKSTAPGDPQGLTYQQLIEKVDLSIFDFQSFSNDYLNETMMTETASVRIDDCPLDSLNKYFSQKELDEQDLRDSAVSKRAVPTIPALIENEPKKQEIEKSEPTVEKDDDIALAFGDAKPGCGFGAPFSTVFDRSDSLDRGWGQSTSRTVQRPLLPIKKVAETKSEVVIDVEETDEQNNSNLLGTPAENPANNVNSPTETTLADRSDVADTDIIKEEREDTPVPEIGMETQDTAATDVCSIGEEQAEEPLGRLESQEEQEDDEKTEEKEEVKEPPVEETNSVARESQEETNNSGSSEKIVSDVSSSQSNCATDISENIRNVQNEINDPPIDHFSLVADSIKRLAISFLNACENALSENNRQVFTGEIFGMEAIYRKLEGLEKRYWRMKITEAKMLESAFE